jgi:hypothetical protein
LQLAEGNAAPRRRQAPKYRKQRDLTLSMGRPKNMMSILAAASHLDPAAVQISMSTTVDDTHLQRSPLDLAVLGHTMFDIMGGNFVASRKPHTVVTGNVIERLFQILVPEWRVDHERM